ncbi:MAG: hypothetical protein I8H94_05555 [Rhodobacteraceae bacterium]|nr:hypothetical protein [Paracoccaceae bacterium]
MKLTLDMNCVIDVEVGRPQADAVKFLVELHRRGSIEVALLAVSASENMKSPGKATGRVFPSSFSVFRKKVELIGWSDLPIVPVPMIVGLTYIGPNTYFVAKDGPIKSDIDALWAVIAPKVSREPRDYLIAGQILDDANIQSEGLAKWRNAWCDVYSAYCHINAGRDVFVTSNTRDFQDNASALLELGLHVIATPAKAVELVQHLVR